jgi:ankyrin repeat protein
MSPRRPAPSRCPGAPPRGAHARAHRGAHARAHGAMREPQPTDPSPSPSPNPNQMSELYAAAKAGDEIQLRELLRTHAKNVDYRTPHGKTPLYEAATEGHSRCVHLLLASNAAVDLAHSSGTTPLMSAVYHGHAVVVEVRACPSCCRVFLSSPPPPVFSSISLLQLPSNLP